MARPWMQHVDRFCHQYLQLEPHLDFPPGEVLKLADVQDAVYSRLFADDAVQYGPPERYRVRTLKELVSRIETAIDDWDEHAVSDGLMSTLSVLLCTPLPPEATSVQQRYYVTYHLSLLAREQSPGHDATVVNQPGVTLLESRSLISAAGTTGLRTWEAALHLGQYLCLNPSVVAGKHILELGAGTGYLSILCAKHLASAHALASDGSDDVVNNLADNFFLNHLQDSSGISPMDVKWGHALVGTEEERWNGGQPVDVVVGADITYDRSVVPALVGTLADLFRLYPRVEMYISATQRNEQTFQAFLDACQKSRLDVGDVQFAVPPRDQQEGPFYNDQVAIRICRVSKP
ncbi:Protein-lysine N-methyltransferase EEF2KMT [Tolypocladium paradoxum]|uniref:Protein-lysine N-methyltransferase EEF2KMT n=1 Tax=Tolypocladium paradoxum TaxID=94208 RepID=A0A2S4KNQ0_9HYPO|nr:Protein-lysine N-methyltransferase EEF2KMT [Tolypocladium paradoxum]